MSISRVGAVASIWGRAVRTVPASSGTSDSRRPSTATITRERIERGIAGKEQAAPELARIVLDRNSIRAHRVTLARAVRELFVGPGDAQRSGKAHRAGRLPRDPVDFLECELMKPQRPCAPDCRDGVVMEVNGAAEQEAAVSSGGAGGDIVGVDPHHAAAEVEQLTDGGEAGATQSDHAHFGAEIGVERGESAPRPVVPNGDVVERLRVHGRWSLVIGNWRVDAKYGTAKPG